uniref:Uncharacterized protein n=1 Tax=Oreochromis aureus TaxID=47969 RepID=A0A668UZH6_OREAU
LDANRGVIYQLEGKPILNRTADPTFDNLFKRCYECLRTEQSVFLTYFLALSLFLTLCSFVLFFLNKCMCNRNTKPVSRHVTGLVLLRL